MQKREQLVKKEKDEKNADQHQRRNDLSEHTHEYENMSSGSLAARD